MQLSPNLISHLAKSLSLNVKVGKVGNIWLHKIASLATYLRAVFSWFFLLPKKVYLFWTLHWVLSTRKTKEEKGSFMRLKKLYIFPNENSLPVFLLIWIKIVHNYILGPIFKWHEKKVRYTYHLSEIIPLQIGCLPKHVFLYTWENWRYTTAKYNSHYFFKNYFQENWKNIQGIRSWQLTQG